MRIFLWAIGAVIFAVAAFAVYQAFQSPAFVAGLSALAAAAAWKAVRPILVTPETKADRASRQQAYRRADGDGDWRRKSGAPPKG